MRQVFIMCGLIGSGKSTWVKQQTEKNHRVRIISKDDIREMVYGKYKYMYKDEEHIKNINELILTYYLYETAFDIIIDETHLTKEKREEVINYIHLYEVTTQVPVQINIIWCTETENNLENRKSNLRGIHIDTWAEVLEGMKKSFQKPTKSELLHKYDQIIKHNI